MTLTVTALVNQIADLIEPHTMARDPDDPAFRVAAQQQAVEEEHERVRAKARAILRRVWDWERERAEATGSPFRAAFARALVADLDREDAA